MISLTVSDLISYYVVLKFWMLLF